MNNAYDDFFEVLGFKESSDNYSKENQYHFIGRYQMGENALIDTGYYKRNSNDTTVNTNDWTGEWTGKDGIYSKQDFLNSSQAQDNAVRSLTSINWGRIENLGLESYLGQNIGGVTITESGMLAAAHLLGVGGLKNFLQNGINGQDANGTTATTYLNLAPGYQTPFGQTTLDSGNLYYTPSNYDFRSTQDIATTFYENIISNINSESLKPVSVVVKSDQSWDSFSSYTTNSFDKAWESLGVGSGLNVSNNGWSSLGSYNSFLDDFTFSSFGRNYTVFGENDRITLPSIGDLNFGGATNFYNVNDAFSSSWNTFLSAQNRISPLVLDLNNNGIETTGLYETKVFFDIDADGYAEKVGWVKPTEGLLAIDTNGNGVIDDITELFGDDKMAAFDKLRKYDLNHDGKINALDNDPTSQKDGYSKLLIWQDLNTNGKTDSGELKTLQAAGVKEISLAETETKIYDKENFISSKSSFTKSDNSTAEIADVHFMNDNVNTWFMGAQSQVYGSTYQVDPETLLLPLSRGYGSLASLHIAMTNDTALKGMVRGIVNLAPSQLDQLADKITAFMYQWAGVTDNDPTSRRAGDGNNIDSRKVDFIEKFTGVKWEQMGVAAQVGDKAALIVKQVWAEIENMLTNRILVQGTLAEIFPHASYSFKTDSITLGDSLAVITANAQSYLTSHNISGDSAHEFWLDIGNILIMQKTELGATISTIAAALDSASGESLHISEVTLTQADGDIYSVKKDASGQYPDEHLTSSVYQGGAGDDHIIGSNHNDFIFGKGGDDTLDGKGGDDFLRGDSGNDIIHGGSGDDRLEGGAGDDMLVGDDGRDDIHGGAGNDTLIGGSGDDRLEGDAGADIIDGGAGINAIAYLDSDKAVYVNLATNKVYGGYATGDTFANIQNIDGSNHDDVLIGDDGNNTINGEGGDDVIYGGAGDDTLFGADGNDRLYGQDGNDTLQGYAGSEIMDGGDGNDMVDYSHPYNKGGVYVNLASGEGHNGAAEGDKYVSIENVIGTDNDDIIIGTDGDNYLNGLGGSDIIKGGGGNDTLVSGGGIDYLEGGTGVDTFVITPNPSGRVYVMDFTPGVDKLDFTNFTSDAVNAADFSMQASNGDTFIHLNDQYIILRGILPAQLSGNDFIFSNDGTDHTIHVSTGTLPNASLDGDEYGNQLIGYFGVDTINGAGGNDKIFGIDGNDILHGADGNDSLQGGFGADVLDGGAGVDTVDYLDSPSGVNINLTNNTASGGSASGDSFISIENINGSMFDDILTGDAGVNWLKGITGNDILNGKGGNDALEGGAGNDRFVIEADSGSRKTITDFEITNPFEKIDLTAFGNISSLDIATNGPDTTVIINGNQYVDLPGISAGYLDSFASGSQFIFAGSTPPIRLQSQAYQSMGNIRLGSSGNDTINGTGTKPEYFADGKGSDTVYLNPQDTYIDLLHVSKQSGDVDTVYNYRSETGTKTTTYAHYTYVGYYPLPTTVYGHVADKRIDLSEFANFQNLNDVLAHSSVSGGDTIIDLGGQQLILKNYQNGTSTTTTATLPDLNNAQAMAATGVTFSAPADWMWTPKQTIEFHYNFIANDFIFYDGTLKGTLADSHLEGGYGADNITSYDGNDTINSYGGNDTITSGSGNDTISAGDGDDIVNAGAGNDNIYGGAGDDTINAGSGDDVVNDGSGNDRMTGGDGDDIFAITKEANANDTITDFEFWRPGEKIDLTQFNGQFTTFATFKSSITKNGENTVINLGGGQSLILQGVKAEYITKDNFIGNASINTAPVATGTINAGSDVVRPGTAWSLVVPNNIFSDADGDVLNYSAKLADGSALPDWMHFDAKTLTFSGIPTSVDVGEYNIKVIASDGSSSANKDFSINVSGLLNATNLRQLVRYTEDQQFSFAPIVVNSITQTTANVTLTLSSAAAGSLSTGTHGSVTASFVNGVWSASGDIADVNFLLATLKFTPSANYHGNFGINVHITDGVNDPVDTTINVTGISVNDLPVSSANTINLSGQEDVPLIIHTGQVNDIEDGIIKPTTNNVVFSNIHAGARVVVNNDGTFTYHGAKDFNGADSFSYQVKDSNGGLTSPVVVSLNIASVNDAPVAGIVATQYGREEDAFHYTLPANIFTDADGDTLTYAATLTDGSALPSWLNFNSTTKEFSGIPLHGTRGIVNVKVTATDGHGGNSALAFGISLDTGVAYAGDTINGNDLAVSPIWKQISTGNADSFVVADINWDTHLDIVADLGVNNVKWYNTLDAHWHDLIDNNPESFQVVNFNADPYPDIVEDLGVEGVKLYMGDNIYQLITSNVEQFKVVDFAQDNNGFLDVVFDDGENGLKLYKVGTSNTLLAQGNVLNMQLVDYDNDGKPDIIADFAANGIWYINNNLSASKQITIMYNGQVTSVHTQFAVADLIPGGNKEIAFSFYDHIYVENGNANAIELGRPEGLGNFLEFAVGDITGDGKADIFASFNGGYLIYSYAENGFSHSFASDGGIISNIKMADWTGDGRLDVIANRSGNGLSVMDGASGLWTTLTGQMAESYEVKDITGDGKLDIIGDFGAGGISIYDRYNTTGHDILIGTAKDDTIHGLGGNDTINGADGWDKLYGDAGADVLNGDAGNDMLSGGTGSNTLTGGDGADIFIINPDYTTIYNATTHTIGGSYNTIITDYNSLLSGEKIDLSAFKHITSFNQLIKIIAPVGTENLGGFLIPSPDGSAYTSVFLRGVDINNLTFDTTHFTLYTNAAPYISNSIPELSAGVGGGFSYVLQDNTFIDPEGTKITYTVNPQVAFTGQSYSGWLHLNTDTGTFYGTPTASDAGVYTIRVNGSDGELASYQDFHITVSPTLIATTPSLLEIYTEDTQLDFNNLNITTAATTVAVTLTLSDVNAGIFTLPTSNSVTSTYNAQTGVWSASGTVADVNTILAALKFNPSANANGNFNIEINVEDGFNTPASGTINVTGVAVNDVPVAIGINNQATAEGEEFSFTVPANSFVDVDGDALIYTAKLSNGLNLPSWLEFNATTHTFSGIPANEDVGNLSLKVIADDSNGGTTESVFTLQVANINNAPSAIGSINPASLAQGESKSIVTASDAQAAFADIDIGDTLTYSLAVNGQAAPIWLAINAATGQVTSSNPANSDVGSYNITMTATDTSGAHISQNFNLVYFPIDRLQNIPIT